MWDGGVTSELFERLVSQGDISRPVGAGKLTNKVPGAAIEARTGEVAGDREGTRQGLRLVVSNMGMRQSTTKRAPWLMAVR